MTTAAASHKPLDIRTIGSHAIRIGDSITQSAPSSGLTAVRFNHKPTLSVENDINQTILGDEDTGHTKLKLQDGEDTYEYEGQPGDNDCTLVLVSDETGDGFILETLESALVYNLTSAPWENDRAKLADSYTILPAVDAMRADGEGDHSEELEDDGEADPDNPFDYRHYMSATSPDTEPVRDHKPTSTMNSPALSTTGSHAPSIQATPVSRPARKPANPMMPNRKPKPRTSTPAKAEQPAKRKPDNVPEVRVTSTKSTRKIQRPVVEDIMLDDAADDEDEDDEGDLVFDDAPNKKSVAKRNAGLGLSQGNAPMSFRSAASSPGSRVSSPAPGSFRQGHAPRSRPADDGDLVMDDDDTQTASNGYRQTQDAEAEDDDVEDLHLGSPARHQAAAPKRDPPPLQVTSRRRSSAHVNAAEGDGDEDDELELEMLRAMAEEEDDEPAAVAVEEEEESEEE
ncbi:hypothetical protein BDZ85DRAFT_104726 [Elsinoe ampelina]|uniref:Transcription elongation factor Eaf N-terminal domain-containing protein n=1 Tax=Elsinoe ampelina TaxID=302913 RepID=A0A6A6GGM6_9PEZI|nr:hypothetical protein BDZ85DRAFT_104726 [Elsinoe ampelina]